MDQLDGARVLLVDGSPPARQSLTRRLDVAGAEVTAVPSTAAALAELKTKPFDVLVFDLGPTATSGYSFMRSLRGSEGPNHGIAAVAVTDRADDQVRIRALAAGFDDFLPKLVIALLVPTVARLRTPR